MDDIDNFVNAVRYTLSVRVGPKLLELAGIIVVIMIIWAGIKYITAGGGKGMETAKNALIAALVGLMIIALAWAIIYFIGNRLFHP